MQGICAITGSTSSRCRGLPPAPSAPPYAPVGPLPTQARRSILDIHTRKWSERPPPELLDELAGQCVGYCGADLKAVCAEAALHAVRRRCEGRWGNDCQLQDDSGGVPCESPAGPWEGINRPEEVLLLRKARPPYSPFPVHDVAAKGRIPLLHACVNPAPQVPADLLL